MDEQKPNKAVVDYFMQVTADKFDDLTKRLDRIEHKTDQLIGFRWMLIGMASVVSALMSLAIAYIHKL